MSEREYDVVLFGATGFTGALTAQYLAGHAPEGLRWALAGRDRGKLASVRGRLVEIDSRWAELPLLSAEVGDAASLRSVAESTRVMISTVGPYINFGEPMVAACAEAGTDYLDLTGEPEFVDLMWLRYHRRATQTGARLVHSCGFDSIPYDLGALYTVQQLPEGVPIALRGFVRADGTFSGGTYHSAVHIMARLRQTAAVARERRRVSAGEAAVAEAAAAVGAAEGAAGERAAGGRRIRSEMGWPHNEPLVGGWVVPAPTIDPQHVVRSAQALDRYGPDFSYSHYLVTKRLPVTVGLIGGAAVVAGLAQLGPTRRLLLKLRDSGDGPSKERRSRAFFRVRIVADYGGPPTQRLITEVSGGDPGYGETSKMLAESALCLAFDSPPERSGQLTPAVAMGQPLIDRLVAAGIRFDVVQ